ncbi:MAG: hypothetical protein KF738_06890 [Burkholderiales bacterium]|nr:hypothetical protein [Burkholderiales bacterium]
MMKLAPLLWVIAASALVGCASAESPGPEIGFKFYDADMQKRLVNSLQREGVVHRVRPDGTALYAPQDEERVSRIRIEVLNEAFVPSAHVGDVTLERRFLERLEKAGIKYAIAERDGKRWISWAQSDDANVNAIRKNLLQGR